MILLRKYSSHKCECVGQYTPVGSKKTQTHSGDDDDDDETSRSWGRNGEFRYPLR